MAEVVMRISGGFAFRPASEVNIRAMVGTLTAGKHLILEYEDEMDSELDVHYIQVWRRPEGAYQLEYRAGSAVEHYQTLTTSQADIVAALFGWSKGETEWRQRFNWKSIGDWFKQE